MEGVDKQYMMDKSDYIINRLDDQITWYSDKSESNMAKKETAQELSDAFLQQIYNK